MELKMSKIFIKKILLSILLLLGIGIINSAYAAHGYSELGLPSDDDDSDFNDNGEVGDDDSDGETTELIIVDDQNNGDDNNDEVLPSSPIPLDHQANSTGRKRK